jgi:hypothetical protein
MYATFIELNSYTHATPLTRLVLDIIRPGGPTSWIITELSILRESLDTSKSSLLTCTVSFLVHPLASHRGQHGRVVPSALIYLPRRLYIRPLLRYRPRSRYRRVPENLCHRSLRISELDNLYAPSLRHPPSPAADDCLLSNGLFGYGSRPGAHRCESQTAGHMEIVCRGAPVERPGWRAALHVWLLRGTADAGCRARRHVWVGPGGGSPFSLTSRIGHCRT